MSADRYAGDDGQRRVALALERGLAGDQRVRAVGGDEVDDRGFVLEIAGEVDPALVGLEQDVVVGRLVELAPGGVQRRHAGIAAARQVDGRQVERQAEQVVAQRAGDELVDLVADLPRHAADDRAGGDVVGDRMVDAVERGRIEEALDQADVIGGEGRVEPVDRLGQHRVAEAVDHVRELGDDRRIDRGVEAVRDHEEVDLAAGSCARTPRTRDAGTASRCRTSRPGTGVRRPRPGRDLRWSRGTAATSSTSHSLRKARSSDVAQAPTSLVCSTSRLCSAWKTWWTAVRPMFSLTRPSPAMKCASSSSLS